MISMVPMIPITNHSYRCVIPLTDRNIELTFTMNYNAVADIWFLDLTKDGEKILASYPLIPAQDILEQFQYMEIGHASIFPRTQEISSQFPGYDTLDTEWVLLWGEENG